MWILKCGSWYSTLDSVWRARAAAVERARSCVDVRARGARRYWDAPKRGVLLGAEDAAKHASDFKAKAKELYDAFTTDVKGKSASELAECEAAIAKLAQQPAAAFAREERKVE